jgi:bleomycin hydrolase
VKKLNLKSFEFSTNYYFFWDRLEKANHFLERAIQKADLDIRSLEYQKFLGGDHLGDGGYWQNAVDIIGKYGVVPLSAMPEVNSNTSSRSLNSVLSFLLKNMAYELKTLKQNMKPLLALRAKKVEFLKQIYKILVLHLGEPVKTFPFRYYSRDKKGKKILTEYKLYTPKTFAKEFVQDKMTDYIMVANWPAREFYKFYEWEGSNNMIDGTRLNFINLPIEVIKKMSLNSIKNNVPVNFSADVGKQMDSKRGIMNSDLFNFSEVYQVPINSDKKVNTLLKNINSTHAMVFTGVDIKDDKPLKWKVENSWGKKSGKNGFYAMYDNWFDLYVVRVVIHKKFIPKSILKLLKNKPELIPDTQPEK